MLAEERVLSGADVTIAGHCGLPFVADVDGHTWFNPGVIGMPANDGSPDGWYGLVEPRREGLALSTHRLAYDHAGASRALLGAGFANPYARALATGLWPSLDVLPETERLATGKPIAPVAVIARRRERLTAAE